MTYRLSKLVKWLLRYGNFSFCFKMAAIHHLGFVGHILGWPTRVLGGFYHCANFGLNALAVLIAQSFENFCVCWLEKTYSCAQNVSFWWISNLMQTPKNTSLCGNTSYDVQIAEICLMVPTKCDSKNKVKKSQSLRKPKHGVTCSLRPLKSSQCHIVLPGWSVPWHGYIFQVSSKSIQEFWSHSALVCQWLTQICWLTDLNIIAHVFCDYNLPIILIFAVFELECYSYTWL